MASAYWIGKDGNVYGKSDNFTGVRNLGKAVGQQNNGVVVQHQNGVSTVLPGAQFIDDPVAGASPSKKLGSGDGEAPDPDVAARASLKNEIKGKSGAIEAIYNALFGDLDTLLKSRDAELTTQYGGQRTKATQQYTDALPEIDQSYAALGSYDSTQRGDSRGKARKGYEDTLATIGQNEKTDRDKLGVYGNEQRAKFTADRDSARQNIGRVDETTDVGALRGMRNDLENNISTAGVTRASLGTNGSQTLQQLTGDNGRYDAAVNALDSILKSSLGSDVKAAAVKAVTDSAGLSEEDKKKVQAQYGNVYAEQAAL